MWSPPGIFTSSHQLFPWGRSWRVPISWGGQEHREHRGRAPGSRFYSHFPLSSFSIILIFHYSHFRPCSEGAGLSRVGFPSCGTLCWGAGQHENHQLLHLEGRGDGQVGDADLGERRRRFWRAEGGQRHHLWAGRAIPVRNSELGKQEWNRKVGSDPKGFQSAEEQAGSGFPRVANMRSLQLFASPASCLLLLLLGLENLRATAGRWHNKWNLVEIKGWSLSICPQMEKGRE